jgi:membrane associated rhomboid family serine protease
MILAIIAITVIISLVGFNNRELFNRLVFNPYVIRYRREGWRFASYALLHANWAHLFINMFVFYSFGNAVLQYYTSPLLFGPKGYLFFILLYLGGTIFSVLFDYRKYRQTPGYNAVGASGAVAAVLFASILLHPTGSIFLFPIPFPIPSIIFGVLYLVYSAVMARRGDDFIGHNAHFWGSVFGIVFTIALRPSLAVDFVEQIIRWLGVG